MTDNVIYLDNAATSWPKPPCVADAISKVLREAGANPGRAAHRLANEAAGVVYDAREAIANLVGAPDPLRVVFGHNVTEALNLALKGLLHPGDHVVTSSIEHNSMMRPLRARQAEGVEVTVVPCSSQGFLDPGDVAKAIKSNTRMLAVTHASNVVGSLQPVGEIGEF